MWGATATIRAKIKQVAEIVAISGVVAVLVQIGVEEWGRTPSRNLSLLPLAVSVEQACVVDGVEAMKLYALDETFYEKLGKSAGREAQNSIEYRNLRESAQLVSDYFLAKKRADAGDGEKIQVSWAPYLEHDRLSVAVNCDPGHLRSKSYIAYVNAVFLMRSPHKYAVWPECRLHVDSHANGGSTRTHTIGVRLQPSDDPSDDPLASAVRAIASSSLFSAVNVVSPDTSHVAQPIQNNVMMIEGTTQVELQYESSLAGRSSKQDVDGIFDLVTNERPYSVRLECGVLNLRGGILSLFNDGTVETVDTGSSMKFEQNRVVRTD